LKVEYDETLSSFAFKSNLRRYIKEEVSTLEKSNAEHADSRAKAHAG